MCKNRSDAALGDTEHQPKNVTDAPPKWNVGILSNRIVTRDDPCHTTIFLRNFGFAELTFARQ